MAELKVLREKGLARLRDIELPALTDAARAVTGDVESPAGAVVEALLRRSVARFGGGNYGDAAALLFGLDQGTRTASPRLRRELAAASIGRSADTFRRRYEPNLLSEIASQVQTLRTEQHAKAASRRRERHDPVESAMAVEWLRRFETYYRIWTPVHGLAADLTACRSTLLELDRSYDRRFGTLSATDPGSSQEEQAEGYADYALYHYARFSWELQQFVVSAGGLWLLSNAENEQALADAVLKIGWSTPWNERDVSFLRSTLSEAPGQELHGFLLALQVTEIGRATAIEWREWTSLCQCKWESRPRDDAYFPTPETDDGISVACEVHQVVAACGSYCSLVDEDWRSVADWYRLNEQPRVGLTAETLYEQRAQRLKSTHVEEGHTTP